MERMLLRRISRHVKEQNWTAICIDFLIVVLGVFMGVQVDRWYQDSKDLDRGRQYLQSVAFDMNSDVEAVEDRRAFWKDVSTYSDQAVSYIETGKLADGSPWKTLLAFYQASQVWRFSSTDTTYIEMRSSGSLDLIEDKNLRRELVNYYVSVKRLAPELFSHSPVYRETVRGLISSKVQNYIWSDCYRQENYKQWLLDCDSPISDAEAQKVIGELKVNSQVRSQLLFWNRNLKVTSEVLQATKSRAEALVAKLNL